MNRCYAVALFVASALEAGTGRAVGLDVSVLPSGAYVYRVEAALPGGVERASGRLTVLR
jgi:hypothetical protein